MSLRNQDRGYAALKSAFQASKISIAFSEIELLPLDEAANIAMGGEISWKIRYRLLACGAQATTRIIEFFDGISIEAWVRGIIEGWEACRSLSSKR